MRLLRHALLSFLLIPFIASADFVATGKGNIKYPTGLMQPLDFKLSFEKGTFSVGPLSMQTPSAPEKYSLGIMLYKDKHVMVQEFANGYFSEFDLTISGHVIKLSKKIFKEKVKGDYVLNIDGIDYFFTSSIGQIEFILGEKGITDIEVQGLVKDIGAKR